DAPVVINGTTTTLAAINEDNSGPPGASASSLFSGHFSDVDDGSTLAGIAITANAATAGEGTWQWLDGSTWTDISTSVSDSNALVLTAGTSIRFLPAANWNGSTPSLTAHLIDDSGGALTSGSTVNLTLTGTGGTTQYSSGTVTLVTQENVNDAPVV